MGEQLDRPDIVQDIIKSRIPYLQDSFFEKETKIAIKKDGFKFKFDDLVEAILRRATVLRASGKESKPSQKPEVAKVAAAQASQLSYGNAATTTTKDTTPTSYKTNMRLLPAPTRIGRMQRVSSTFIPRET